ncbi:MAG: hypothetical protein U9O06_07115 [Euryarchaeota archaeon]|nr:hypothetical protein [Euryarchaeota archaeon]
MSDSDAATEGRGTAATDTDEGGRRDVVVPLRLYKTITVFSTLIAAASILAGFILLDAATLQVSVLRNLIVSAIEAVGVTPNQDLLGGLLAIAGLGLMAFGSGVFILSSRFRAAGMGNAQEDADED